MSNFKLPDGYANLDQRAYQSWNADAKKFLTEESNIIDLSSFIAPPFINGLNGQPETGLKLYRHLDGTYHMRGAVQYPGPPVTNGILLFLFPLTDILKELDIKTYVDSAQTAMAIDPNVGGAISPVAIKWDNSNVIEMSVGLDALDPNFAIFIDYIFYPNSI